MTRATFTAAGALVGILLSGIARADDLTTGSPATPNSAAAAPSLNNVIVRAEASENALFARLQALHPIVETYIQRTREDNELGSVPTTDFYFLGKLAIHGGVDEESFMPASGPGRRFFSSIANIRKVSFIPRGFAQMSVMDAGGFNQANYTFRFVKREFLGDVRTIVMDVLPREGSGQGRFTGRMWVEDAGYHVVRFSGTYDQPLAHRYYFHFDSWRVNCGPDLWLPAYIYSEEGSMKGAGGIRIPQFRAQTRLWGYEPEKQQTDEAFTNLTVDVPQGADDQSEAAAETSPVEAARRWEQQAEDNVDERLEKAGLMAAPGPVDKVLQTVLQNLEVSNNLVLNPEVRVRMLMTTPLECFAVGRTIVVSRGLLDVLPDEASLAAVLARELAHIALGQPSDSRYAFADRLFIEDREILNKVSLARRAAEEQRADERAMQILKKSPYAQKLPRAGLFFRALNARSAAMPNLIRPLLGDRIAAGGSQARFAELASLSPELHLDRADEIEALPLGSRVNVDPWSNQAHLIKTENVHLLSAREKYLFEVTPFWPHLRRQKSTTTSTSVTTAAPVVSAAK